MTIRVPAYINYIVRVFIFNLFLFSLCRILFFLAAYNKWPEITGFNSKDIIVAFLIGVRFDTVVLSYLLILPFLLLGIISFFTRSVQRLYKGIHYFLFISICICLLILVSNVPYFIQFFSPLSAAAFLWIDHPGYTLQLIVQEKSFYIFLLPLVIFVLSEHYFLKNLTRKTIRNFDLNKDNSGSNQKYNLFILLLGSLLLVIGIRGRISGKATIQTGTAYFSDNPLLNNTGLNPVYTLFHSMLMEFNPSNARVQLMSTEKALQITAASLRKDSTEIDPNFPMARMVQPKGKKEAKNVVIVIMEAMSKFKMGKWGGPVNLTPNLNALIKESYYFDHIYTSGIHTFNGIYSTLFSFPALYKQHPLKLLAQIPHDGLANILKKEEYQTSFFTTHDAEFDNVRGFLKANGFDNVFSENDYPSEWILSTNGVPDHIMFEHAIPQLNKMASSGKPFFTTFMTTSDHGPYIVPQGINFKPVSKEITDQIVEYADWSIGQFISDAKQTKWFNNTIFIFVADHGLSMGHTYDMPLSFHETPLLFYAPEFLTKAKVIDNLGGQIDIAPTLLGLLNISYVNNTPGIDLLREERPFMYFCADDKIGCIDKQHYFIQRKNGIETLFEYENLNMENMLKSYPGKVDSMKNFTHSIMQTTQWMIDNKRLKYTDSHGK
ncbi:MAG: LTA synthase family protein [Bacteroidia bacterium]|nr:LTA synthase family protein [Bacteroidia bacterium]